MKLRLKTQLDEKFRLGSAVSIPRHFFAIFNAHYDKGLKRLRKRTLNEGKPTLE